VGDEKLIECDKKYVVYRHIFPNEKSYIGITSQYPFWRRWRAGSGYHRQSKIYNAIQKYGWKNVRHEILAENLSIDDANRIEQEMVAKFDSVKNGYNISAGGGGTYGIPCSEETRGKIGRSNRGKSSGNASSLLRYMNEHGAWNKGKPLTGEHYRKVAEERRRRCNKRIGCYDPVSHRLLKIYESCTVAANTVGVSKETISRCARGRRKTSAGFEWRYLT
jgi:group I intron endonuclease